MIDVRGVRAAQDQATPAGETAIVRTAAVLVLALATLAVPAPAGAEPGPAPARAPAGRPVSVLLELDTEAAAPAWRRAADDARRERRSPDAVGAAAARAGADQRA
ncbi:hypothetical protein ACFQMG_36700, partial [Kitasatospora paranensis]